MATTEGEYRGCDILPLLFLKTLVVLKECVHCYLMIDKNQKFRDILFTIAIIFVIIYKKTR